MRLWFWFFSLGTWDLSNWRRFPPWAFRRLVFRWRMRNRWTCFYRVILWIFLSADTWGSLRWWCHWGRFQVWVYRDHLQWLSRYGLDRLSWVWIRPWYSWSCQAYKRSVFPFPFFGMWISTPATCDGSWTVRPSCEPTWSLVWSWGYAIRFVSRCAGRVSARKRKLSTLPSRRSSRLRTLIYQCRSSLIIICFITTTTVCHPNTATIRLMSC